jgi:hypothetical protein
MPNENQIFNLTDEQIKRGNQLEGIFIPHARRHRDVIYKSGKSPLVRFVHYTTAEAALKIISQKCLWMRNATCMSDYLEVQHGFMILNRFFSDKDKAKSFNDAVNTCAPGAADVAIGLFNQWWNKIRFNTYIFSISEHDDEEDYHGRLSMWRAFGGTTARVAIVFKVPAYSQAAVAMGLRFSPVAYLKDAETNKLIPEVISNIIKHKEFLSSISKQEIVNWIFHMLLVDVTCLKHEGFREEKEWRVVHCPQIDSASSLIKSSTETIGGVPQLVYKLPLDMVVDPILADLDILRIFDRLIIGPSPYPVVMADAFITALLTAGVVDAPQKVFASNIPIRA